MTQQTTGYPYLVFARQSGLDYGLVLSYADALIKRVLEPGRPFTEWQLDAIGKLHGTINGDAVKRLARQTLREKGHPESPSWL